MRRVRWVMWLTFVVAGGAVVAGLACGVSDNLALENDDTPPMDGAGPEGDSCVVDSDCQPAASTCCECASFATSAADSYNDGCSEVNCEGLREENCSLLAEPVCVQGLCELLCRPLILEQDETCSVGFQRDEFGCATKTCGSPDPDFGGCTVNSDCVQVKDDCCGCAAGGADTAVLASEKASFEAALGCTGDEICPGVFVCEEGVIPQCFAGACVLGAEGTSDPPDMGPGATTPCGLNELPPCPAGEVCVLNDPEANDAGEFGVGICRSE